MALTKSLILDVADDVLFELGSEDLSISQQAEIAREIADRLADQSDDVTDDLDPTPEEQE